MEFRDCLHSATENPVCHLAPTEGDQPRVRVLRIWFADEDGSYPCGLVLKSAWRQSRANPNVEIRSLNHATDLQAVRSMRVTRKVRPDRSSETCQVARVTRKAEFLEPKDKVPFILGETEAERVRS